MSLLYDSYKYNSELLLTLLKKYNKGNEVFNIIKKETKNGKKEVLDKDLYTVIRDSLGQLSILSKGTEISTRYEFKRAKKRAKEILEISKDNIKNIDTYLDIGIGKGIITHMTGKYLKASTYGIDISDERDPNVYNKFTFSIYDGINIPYAGFDVITIIMVLHHVSDIDQFMKKLHYSLEPDGIIIIRDHDISMVSEDDHNTNALRLVKIQHEIMSELYGDTSIYSKDYYENYYSKNELIEIFKKYKFTIIDNKTLDKYFSPKFNPTKYYYMVIKKV
jgi:2-polyprenyl-3-methyl-5-hydroxy-6-metoxy-1,4-benzoquinol methylase